MGRFYAICEFFVIKTLILDKLGCFFKVINLELYFLSLTLVISFVEANLMLF